MRLGLLQLRSSDDPVSNLVETRRYIQDAAEQGAEFILTPEVTNCLSTSRSHQRKVLQHEADDITLATLREDAARLGIWLLIGSLALKTDDADGRFANRSFLIDPTGECVAWYDKIHMFDVAINETEHYRESEGYRPGTRAVVAQTGFARIGLSICYDIRFPALYRDLAQSGAGIVTIPAAFSPVTGVAHWEPLLRARAIETGCFVIAPAQTGKHSLSYGKPRETHGHSMVVNPWGEVLLDAGKAPGIYLTEIDLNEIDDARQRVPSLEHDQTYTLTK